jgi:hypothetical protein
MEVTSSLRPGQWFPTRGEREDPNRLTFGGSVPSDAWRLVKTAMEADVESYGGDNRVGVQRACLMVMDHLTRVQGFSCSWRQVDEIGWVPRCSRGPKEVWPLTLALTWWETGKQP